VIRRASVVLLIVAACLSLSACATSTPIPTPSSSQIVGTWKHGSAEIEFDPDGTFLASDIPKGVIEQSGVALGSKPAGPAESVAGKWSVGTGGTDAGGAPGVQLDFVSPQKIGFDFGMTLIVSSDLPPQLYLLLGHPDANDRYSFTKQSS
jgi:hypothetical protein